MPAELPAIFHASTQFDNLLLRREKDAQIRLVRAYGEAWQRIEAELARVQQQIRRLEAEGDSARGRRIFRERLLALKQQALAEHSSLLRGAAQETERLQADGVRAAGAHAEQLAAMQVPKEELPALRAAWNRLPAEALQAQVGFLSDGSPLLDVLLRVAGEATQEFGHTLATGIALGWNPRRTARELRRTFGTAANRALMIARTESLRSYREATYRNYAANADVLDGWVWNAHLGRRTCAACLAMHGTKHPLSERLQDHPNGRCSMIPLAKGFAELGLSDVAQTRRQTLPDAAMWLRAQDSGTQALVLGSIKAARAFQEDRVSLADSTSGEARHSASSSRDSR
jgi:SPP1 gp7 family putative phage head morphogenesis protein